MRFDGYHYRAGDTEVALWAGAGESRFFSGLPVSHHPLRASRRGKTVVLLREDLAAATSRCLAYCVAVPEAMSTDYSLVVSGAGGTLDRGLWSLQTAEGEVRGARHYGPGHCHLVSGHRVVDLRQETSIALVGAGGPCSCRVRRRRRKRPLEIVEGLEALLAMLRGARVESVVHWVVEGAKRG